MPPVFSSNALLPAVRRRLSNAWLAALLLAATVALAWLPSGRAAVAQPASDAPGRSGIVQAGVSAAPGAGVQLVYVQPRFFFFTVEGAFYADVQAPFSEDAEQRFQGAVALGGAVRVFEAARVAAGYGLPGQLDVGLRAGPGLGFRADETEAERNQRFRLLADPFARYVHGLGRVRVYGEVGLARPRLRAGLWLLL